MDSKMYLKKGYKINLEIESKKEVVAELRASLDGLKGIEITEKVQGGSIPGDDKFVNKLHKILEMEKEIERLKDFKFELSESIDKVENLLERTLLRYRYVLSLTWEEISEKTGYSLRQVIRIHRKAIKNFEYVTKCH